MRIGVLELLCSTVGHPWPQTVFGFLVVKQYASIMPQAVSVWCRGAGHEVFYATYYGQADPYQLLPTDLDVVFLSAYTQASGLAYALAKRYRQQGVFTVLGGPHAKQFPEDSLRFFDCVVGACDHTLIRELLADLPRGQILSSTRPLLALPSVEERMPEIRASTFLWKRQYPFASVPTLTSLGCPNACDFCIEWDSTYHLMPASQIEADMRFLFKKFKNLIITFHDPHFGVRFDEVFRILENIPGRPPNRYILETSLAMLETSRLARLRQLGDVYLVTGIETWSAFSHKVGLAPDYGGRRKLEAVLAQVAEIRKYVIGLQANFMFGLDTDMGDEPVALTKAFAARAPYVIPTFNIPVPFGRTPMRERWLEADRVLTTMPFAFYYMPFLTYRPKHYSPEDFYEKFSNLFGYLASWEMLRRRIGSSTGPVLGLFNVVKSLRYRQMLAQFRELLARLRTDPGFRAFHERETDMLPEYYHQLYERMLGPYAGLVSREERLPLGSQAAPARV